VPAENEAVRWRLVNGNVRDTILAVLNLFYEEGPGGGHFENLRGPYTQPGCGIAAGNGIMTLVQIFR
jgi:hypothetical protein